MVMRDNLVYEFSEDERQRFLATFDMLIKYLKEDLTKSEERKEALIGVVKDLKRKISETPY